MTIKWKIVWLKHHAHDSKWADPNSWFDINAAYAHLNGFMGLGIDQWNGYVEEDEHIKKLKIEIHNSE